MEALKGNKSDPAQRTRDCRLGGGGLMMQMRTNEATKPRDYGGKHGSEES